MLKLKPGVAVAGIRPEMMLAVIAAERAFSSADCIITSALDGRHSLTSLHYAGQAIDLRTRHVSKATAETVVAVLKEALTIDYDVILESTHIHVEFQPKRRD